jgi:hypothetical protein
LIEERSDQSIQSRSNAITETIGRSGVDGKQNAAKLRQYFTFGIAASREGERISPSFAQRDGKPCN